MALPTFDKDGQDMCTMCSALLAGAGTKDTLVQSRFLKMKSSY